MRLTEVYALRCWGCERDIEIPCRGKHECPHCGAALDIRFRDSDAAQADPVCTHTTEVASEPADSAPNPAQTAQDATENCQ